MRKMSDGINWNDGTEKYNLRDKIEKLEADNARLRKALKDLVDAEWMMSHDWGGDRQSVLDQASAALTATGNDQSKGSKS